jgi:hypothetical protein
VERLLVGVWAGAERGTVQKGFKLIRPKSRAI